MADEYGNPDTSGWKNEPEYLDVWKPLVQTIRQQPWPFALFAVVMGIEVVAMTLAHHVFLVIVAAPFFSMLFQKEAPANRSTRSVNSLLVKATLYRDLKPFGDCWGKLWDSEGLLKFVGTDVEFAIPRTSLRQLTNQEEKWSAKMTKSFNVGVGVEDARYLVGFTTAEGDSLNKVAALFENCTSSVSAPIVLPPSKPCKRSYVQRLVASRIGLLFLAPLIGASMATSYFGSQWSIAIGSLVAALFWFQETSIRNDFRDFSEYGNEHPLRLKHSADPAPLEELKLESTDLLSLH